MKKTEMVITLLDLAKANGWVGDYWDSIDEMRFKMGITSVIWPIIFSHNFAKAVYGLNTLNKELDPHDLSKMEEDFNGFYGVLRYAYQEGGSLQWIGSSWEYHLQQQVMSEDPIKYMYDNRRK